LYYVHLFSAVQALLGVWMGHGAHITEFMLFPYKTFVGYVA